MWLSKIVNVQFNVHILDVKFIMFLCKCLQFWCSKFPYLMLPSQIGHWSVRFKLTLLLIKGQQKNIWQSIAQHLNSLNILDLYLQSNLCTTATLRTPKKWPLLTNGRCSDVTYALKIQKGIWKWWSLQTNGRCLGVVISSGLDHRRLDWLDCWVKFVQMEHFRFLFCLHHTFQNNLT